MLARETFAAVGNLLQTKRMKDFVSNFGCHLTDAVRYVVFFTLTVSLQWHLCFYVVVTSTELSTSFISALTAHLMPILGSLLDSRASQNAESHWLAIFFSLLCKNGERSCLDHLLPPAHDSAIVSCLKAPSKSPRIPNRTKKYQSFIYCALIKYQTS